MTREEFYQLLVRIDSSNKEYARRAFDGEYVNLPIIAWNTAAYCFINNVDDSGDAEELKQQLLYLQEKGYFNFEGE